MQGNVWLLYHTFCIDAPSYRVIPYRKKTGDKTVTFWFILYIAIIPVVPLVGAYIYKRRNDIVRRNVCYGVSVLQLFLSIGYLLHWLKYY